MSHIPADVLPSATGDAGRPSQLVASPIPTAWTPFVARERETAAALDLLRRPSTRLLTMTGPGGVGKTRLALHVAESARDSFPDGAAFVPLAPVADPALVAAAIAQTLAVFESAESSALGQVAAALRGRRLLLVLDNFEHLLDAAPAVADLIGLCPELKVLTTSRSPLHLTAEQELPVPPLTPPSAGHAPDLASLAGNEAVRLFVQRAGAVAPAFSLTAENAGAVAEVCRRLDGLPLAIELAAARTKVLSPPALLARLDHSLQLLAGGPRDQPARLQSVRDAVAWSHDLLDPDERRLFRRLAVFRGDFTLDAAEAVCEDGEGGLAGGRREAKGDGASPSVFEGVASLLDKSLLAAQGTVGGEPRFGMLETVREFALEQLAGAGEAEEVRRRHAEWYLALAERAELALYRGPDQAAWFDRVEAESANLRAALTRLVELSPEAGLRAAAAFPRFWLIRGRLSEGRTWLERALAAGAGPPSRLRAKAWAGLCLLATFQDDQPRATAAGEEAERVSREAGDPWAIAYTQGIRAFHALYQGNLGDASSRAEESCALWYGIEDDGRSFDARNGLAIVAERAGQWDQAERLAAESMAHAKRLGDELGVAIALHRSATIAFGRGDHASALTRFSEALQRLVRLGAYWTAAYALDALAVAARARSSDEQAARLLAAAAHQREMAGVTLPGPLRTAHDQAIATVRAALGEPAFAAAWAAGEALSLEAVLAEAAALAAAAGQPAMAPRSPASGLTDREVEVLRLAVAGLTGPQIADRLFVSPRTVHAHLAAVYRKLDVTTRGEAVRVALERGLA